MDTGEISFLRSEKGEEPELLGCDAVSNDALLALGRQGELVVEMKAMGSDNMAILTGFFTAFGIDHVLSLDRGDFEDAWVFYGFALSLGATLMSGIGCVLLFTFFSIKVRRLLGRSWFHFGVDTSVIVLEEIAGGHEALRKNLSRRTHRSRHRTTVNLFARDWYYGVARYNGGWLYRAGLLGFRVHLTAALCAVMCRVWDAAPSGVTWAYGGFFILGPFGAWLALRLGEATQGLH